MTHYLRGSLYHLVLQALSDLHNDDGNWFYINTYSSIHAEMPVTATMSQMRKAMKVLRQNGHVAYSQAFSEDDNLVQGSGHYITKEGIAFLQELNKGASKL